MPDNLPTNYDKYLPKEVRGDKEKMKDPESYPVGCVTYENFFTHEEMKEMEKKVL